MENNSPLKNKNEKYFITEEERKNLIENQNKITTETKTEQEENPNKNQYSAERMESNEFITDSENLQSEENEDSESNMNEILQINKEFICEFYQAIKDDNVPFLEEFIKADANMKCIF